MLHHCGRLLLARLGLHFSTMRLKSRAQIIRSWLDSRSTPSPPNAPSGSGIQPTE